MHITTTGISNFWKFKGTAFVLPPVVNQELLVYSSVAGALAVKSTVPLYKYSISHRLVCLSNFNFITVNSHIILGASSKMLCVLDINSMHVLSCDSP